MAAQAETPPSAFRSLLKGTALYSVALFGQRLATTFLLLPVTSRLLSTSDFGVLELVEQIIVIVSVLVGSQIAALGYFYFEPDDPHARSRVASTALIGSGLLGGLAGGIALLLVNPISRLVFINQANVRPALAISFIFVGFGFVIEAALGWIRIVDRPVIYGVATLIRTTVAILATLILVAGLRLGILGVILSSTLAILSTAGFLLVYFFRHVPIAFDRKLFIRMVRFAIPMIAGSLAMFVIHFGDRFILPHYRPFSDLGVYGIAYKLGMVISLAYGAFSVYWAARVFEFVRREDAGILIPRVATYVVMGLSFGSLGLIVFSHPVVCLLTTTKFEKAAALAPVIIGAYYVRSIAEFFRCFFLVAGKPLYESICNWIGAGVCLISYFELIPRYGIWGAAVATALTFFVMGIVSIVWSTRLRRYNWETVRMLKIFSVLSALITIHYLLPKVSLITEIVWGLILVGAFPMLIWLVRVPLPGESERAWQLAGETLRRVQRVVVG